MRYAIDISSDIIAIYGGEAPLFLGRKNIDMQFGKILVELDKKKAISEYLVINGPGGFTNLRVGTLALNLLQTLKKNTLKFFSLSKIDLYQKWYDQGRIPRFGIIYIGQRLNLWLRDFYEEKLLKTVKKDSLKELFVEYPDCFVDQVYDEAYFTEKLPQVSYAFDAHGGILHFRQETFHFPWEEVMIHQVEKLIPNYMIDPNVS